MVLVCYFLPYIAGVISFIPFGLGVLDFSIVGVMSNLYGIANAIAFSTAISFRLLATVPLVIWGYCCYVYQTIRTKKIKEVNNMETIKKLNAT